MREERCVRVGRIEGTRGREKVIFLGGRICFGRGRKVSNDEGMESQGVFFQGGERGA